MTANTEGILDYLHEFKEKVQKGHDIFTVGEANGVPAEGCCFPVTAMQKRGNSGLTKQSVIEDKIKQNK